jgi:putative two-component system response regulator
LSGYDIPLEGRLMAIADVYDALISARPYKRALSALEAEEIIEAGRGSHFDPALVDMFHRVSARCAETAGHGSEAAGHGLRAAPPPWQNESAAARCSPGRAAVM